MSQEAFASAFGFTVHQVRQWEQGRNRPLGAMRAYLMLIDHDAAAVLASLRKDVGRHAMCADTLGWPLIGRYEVIPPRGARVRRRG
jgi:transcriptional regulator with XRE-family HTH domain